MNKKVTLLSLAIGSLLCGNSYAQSLPDEWEISPDGKRIVIGRVAPTGLYDSSLIRDVYINFSQTNFWNLLTANYSSKTNLIADLVVDGVTYDSVGVRFRGNTSYQMTGSSQKKSFRVDMNFVHDNQDLMGYNTLKMNNSAEDRSFLREVFYLHQIKKYIPAAKANFVHLWLNNQDWGIYPNIQQLDKDYYKQWFLSNDGTSWRADSPTGGMGGGWGDGTAGMNYLGTDTTSYKSRYTLKSSDVLQPWDDLVATCSTLNNSGANIATLLPSVLDIDRTLWFLACEIAFTDDDSYVMKGKMDYYAYYEPETGRMTPIEYDGNSTFETSAVTSWSPFYHETNANYPLLNKILAVPAWRQRYLAHMRTIVNESLDTASCNAMINNYNTQIDALVNSDPKKLYTYANYVSELTVLKNFVKNRKAYLLSNTEMAQVAPTINNVNYSNVNGQLWTAPADNEGANVTANITSTNGIDHVTLYYATGLTGNFTAAQMYDDGTHNDSASGDGIYGAAIPAYTSGTWVRFYVEAAGGNTAKSVSFMPVGAEHDVYYYNIVPAVATNKPVTINEVMSANTTYIADGAGEYDDWIELYNKTSSPVDIGGYYITDNFANITKWQVPAGTTIPANGYVTFWADEDSSQGVDHMNFKLSSEGEFIYLVNANKQLVDSVTFTAQMVDSSYSRIPNGTGVFVIKNPTHGFNNEMTTGVENTPTAQNEMLIYPNPASNQVYVKIDKLTKGQMLEMRNSLGQLVHQQAAKNTNTINTATFATGLYYVRYGNTTYKLVIMR